jgi:rhodanese-related sulfurtransferase
VQQQIFSLDDEFLLYPAHDYSGRMVTSVKEEKAFNPRLALHVRQEDFVGYMEHLGLPHPKKMEEAVPANLECGRPKEGRHSPALLAWGPAVRTYAGVWQVEPEWVASHRDDVTIIDVREKQEAASDLLGTLSGSVLVPLSEMRTSVHRVPRGRPVVTLCPSGARSAIAAQILEQAGVEEVANLRGGMQKWRDLGYPLDPQ